MEPVCNNRPNCIQADRITKLEGRNNAIMDQLAELKTDTKENFQRLEAKFDGKFDKLFTAIHDHMLKAAMRSEVDELHRELGELSKKVWAASGIMSIVTAVVTAAVVAYVK